MSGKDPEATNPGLTQSEDGTISIGQAASEHSRKKAETEAFAHAQTEVMDPLNELTESPTDPDYIDGESGSPGTLPEYPGKAA